MSTFFVTFIMSNKLKTMKHLQEIYQQVKSGQLAVTAEILTQLEEFYIEAKRRYYKGETLIISDWDFDQDPRSLEAILIEEGSKVIDIVDGDDTIGERFMHWTKMLSLEKVQILDEEYPTQQDAKTTVVALKALNNFFNRTMTIDHEGSGKYDGIAMDLQYIDGKLTKSLTRGEEIRGGGLDKIEKMRLIVPNTIPQTANCEIRGEVVINKKLWQQKYSDPNKIDNPRNYVAGVFNKDDATEEAVKDLTFIAYHLVIQPDTERIYTADTMTTLQLYGFNDKYQPFTAKLDTHTTFPEVYQAFKHYRENVCPFQLDGIVLKANERFRNGLGETSHHPKWAMAVKFPPQKVITTILDIIWNVGTTGYLTPIAILQPVELDGTEVKRASLHNYSNIIKSGASIGAEVIIAKKGDIIPQVIEVVTPGNGEIPTPETCECGGMIHLIEGKGEDTSNLKCTNPYCKVQAIGKLESGIKILQMARIGGSTAAKLYEAGFETIESLFDKSLFNKEALIESGQFKEGRALEIVLNGVNNVKSIHIQHVVQALKFENVGNSISREIGKYLTSDDNVIPNFDGLQKSLIETLQDPSSFERIRIMEFMQILRDNGIGIEYFKAEVFDENSIGFIMTGKTKAFGWKTKAEFAKTLPSNYIEVKKMKEAKILFTDDLNSGTRKMEDAAKYNVEVKLYGE